jgi:pSer/pThr/pTyr-binding forkhead associated (FHA) protein
MWILESDDTGRRATFRIPAGTVKTIGRSTGAELILDAALVSRLHCQITAGADTLDVKDLDSTNGTFVNGKRIAASPLRSGDTLSIGRVHLKVTRQAG